MTATQPTIRSRSWMRLDGVDALRGLAIFFVLMNHVNMRLYLAHIPYTAGLPEQLVSSLVWNGQNGVQIFFGAQNELFGMAGCSMVVAPSVFPVRTAVAAPSPSATLSFMM